VLKMYFFRIGECEMNNHVVEPGWRIGWEPEAGRGHRPPPRAAPGPVSRERRSSQQWARLEAELRRGPLAHGFADDQRWTLSRIKTLIGRLFHVGYTVEGTWKLLRGHGWSCRRMERPNRARFRAVPSVT
jgi:transposase